MATPTLECLIAEPTLAFELPRDAIVGRLAKLGALQAILLAALAGRTEAPATARDDRLMMVDEAAAMLGVTKDWIYRRAKRLGIAVPLAAGTLRYSRAAIAEVIRNRRMSTVASRRRLRSSARAIDTLGPRL